MSLSQGSEVRVLSWSAAGGSPHHWRAQPALQIRSAEELEKAAAFLFLINWF